MTLAILASVSVVLGVACGTQTTDSRPSSTSTNSQTLDPATVPQDRACSGGATEPTQIEELIEVFRRHDLEMFEDPECLSFDRERQASNAPTFGPNRVPAGDEYDDVLRTQGYVTCGLWASPENPLQPVKEAKREGDEETKFAFGNVRCTIYPDDASEHEQVERLRRAAAELARLTAEER